MIEKTDTITYTKFNNTRSVFGNTKKIETSNNDIANCCGSILDLSLDEGSHDTSCGSVVFNGDPGGSGSHPKCFREIPELIPGTAVAAGRQ